MKKIICMLLSCAIVFSTSICAFAADARGELLSRGLTEQNLHTLLHLSFSLEEAAGFTDEELREILGSGFGRTLPTPRGLVTVTGIPDENAQGNATEQFHSSSGMKAGSFYGANNGTYIQTKLEKFCKQVFKRDAKKFYHLYGEYTGYGYHKGVDLSCADGTPIYSAHVGETLFGETYGVVSVWDGTTSNIYAHMKNKTTAGRVKLGDRLGNQSNVSAQTIGSHLHFEARNKRTSSMNYQETDVFSSNLRPYDAMPMVYYSLDE